MPPQNTSFDVIIVGAGAAGSLAAMLFAEAGAKVLVLDAGFRPGLVRAPLRTLSASFARRLANSQWLPKTAIRVGRRALRAVGKVRQPVQTKCFAWDQAPDSFVDDRDCPYIAEGGAPFLWLRARQPGGRMTIPGHGRQYYRLSPTDFTPLDGLSEPWPFTAGTLDPWYAYVEDRLGLCGGDEGSSLLPDSVLRTRISPTAIESDTRSRLAARWPGMQSLLGRSAAPLLGSSLADATGRLLVRSGAIVRHVVASKGKVEGVVWIDAQTKCVQTSSAPIVFLCASALESTRILLLSTTRSGAPLFDGSNSLGRNLMDHLMIGGDGVGAALENASGPLAPGRCVFVPRFDVQAWPGCATPRGFNAQIYLWSDEARSYLTIITFGEMLPRPDSRVALDDSRTDAWGIPVLRIACRYGDYERNSAEKQVAAVKSIAEALNVKLRRADKTFIAGAAMHECGTARMGRAPDSSVLDSNNECWNARGLYVTDGAAFPSQGVQNPTLTIMALTARACAHGGGAKQVDERRMAKALLA